MNRRLGAWLALVGAQAALGYASRATGGKPPKNALYHWDIAIGGVFQYAIILGIVVAIGSVAPHRLFALRSPASWPKALGLSLLVLIGIYALAAALDPVLHPGREQGLTPSGWQPHHAAAFAANFVVIAAIAPIVEELTFRGLGFSLLERWGRTFAIVAVGILFGLAHGLVEALPILAAFGIGLAWLRSRTQSVYPGILLHAAFNAIALTVAVAH